MLTIINEIFNPGKLMATSVTFFNSLQSTTGYSKAQISKVSKALNLFLLANLPRIVKRISVMVITTTYLLMKVVIS